MIHVSFRPSELKDPAQRHWFASWLRRARRATKQVIADVEAGRSAKFNQNIWSELKDFLLKGPFKGKCAYCESRVTTTDFGDAEHYRPKKAVTHRVNGKTKSVEYGGVPHPGYYWLAHDWRNILPACGQCNSGSGKMNQFPIAEGSAHVTSHTQARSPMTLDDIERPRLLHPYFHRPEKYLRFGQDGTIAAAENDPLNCGPNSIEVYNLRRGDLDGSRREYQEKAWADFLKALFSDMPFAQAMQKYDSGESPYSLACIQYVHMKYQLRGKELGL